MDNLTPITREEMLMNDEPLTPITREEKILAGEDLTPVTRREYFLKKYRHAGGDVMVEGLSVTANGTYTAPEGKAYSPVEVAVPLPENAYLLKEASGSLVSFSDGADLPMPSFICNITANQDLHGYDAPWVGGSGKNKLPLTVDTIKSLNTSGTWNDNVYSINGGTLTIMTDNSGNVVGISVNGTFSAQTDIKLVNSYGSTDSFIGQGSYYINCANMVAETEIHYGYGSSVFGVLNNTSDREVDISGSIPGMSFVLLRLVSNTLINTTLKPMIRLSSVSDPTFAPYENICPISGHTGVDATVSPTTEASAGTTYSVSWQTEAGEVYGGYVDLVSGVLTVDRMGVTYSDTNKKRDDGSFRLYPAPSNALVTNVDNEQPSPLFICNKFKFMSIFEVITTSAVNVGIGISKTSNGFYIKDTAMLQMTLEEAKTYLSSHPIDVVYPLAEAQTYQLTPTQIKSLLGNNNAWCSTGDVDIDYFAKEV